MRFSNVGVSIATFAVLGALSCDRSQPEQPAAAASVAMPEPPASVAAPAAPAPEAPAQGLLEVGDAAPDVQAVAHSGQAVRLSELKGKPVVVYFYPRDDTGGCTAEAEGIRDVWVDLSEKKAVVLGVSTDDNVSHRAFASKYKLPFLLLPDTDHAIAKAFGVPLSGGSAKRVTFIIGPDGKIEKVFPDVNPDGHAKQILEALDSISG
jgi:peroxiredoxin Q/BCP